MMAGIKSINTRPEVALRKLLHRSGFRFRVHSRELPGKPDIVLHRYRTAIFVHGCFWHGHENCRHFRLPKSRTVFWQNKIEANKLRDRQAIAALNALGWQIIILWECTLPPKGADFLGAGLNELTEKIRKNLQG